MAVAQWPLSMDETQFWLFCAPLPVRSPGVSTIRIRGAPSHDR